MESVKNFYSLKAFITVEIQDELFHTSVTNLGGMSPHWN
jgi:hypothetical protein